VSRLGIVVCGFCTVVIHHCSSVADQEGGAEDQKSQSAVFTIPEKAVPEQSVGDVRITQLDWKRVPQARSRGCKVLSP